MKNLIDLHTHSLISDGACSPTDLVKAAYKNNVKALALTDHDSIAGIKEASTVAKIFNIDVLTGIEISALHSDGRMLHILGLGMDVSNEKFLTPYIKMKKAREASMPNILITLKAKFNLDIDINVLEDRMLDEYLSRHDIHRYIIDNKLCDISKRVWNTYLDPIPFDKDELIPISDAINMINNSGGLSFLAHYNNKNGFIEFSKAEIENEVEYLVSLGLKGIERYYPTFSRNDEKFLDYLIERYNLVPCGGSDFHGYHRANTDIGIGNGTFSVPYEIYSNLTQSLKNTSPQPIV